MHENKVHDILEERNREVLMLRRRIAEARRLFERVEAVTKDAGWEDNYYLFEEWQLDVDTWPKENPCDTNT